MPFSSLNPFSRPPPPPPKPLPALPPELQLHIALLSLPPPTQHRTLITSLSTLSLVSPSFRHWAQSLLFQQVRYVLGWRQYSHCMSRHWRQMEKSAEEYKRKKLQERLRWLREKRGRGKVRILEVSLLLLWMRPEEGVLEMLREDLGLSVVELSVRYDVETGAAFLPAFLAMFPNVKRLHLQTETMSDPAPLPSIFYPSSSPSFTTNPPLPNPLANLTHLSLSRLAFDLFPPLPLHSLLSLSCLDLSFNSSSLSRNAIDSFFSFTPSVIYLTWSCRTLRLSPAAFNGAPGCLRAVDYSIRSGAEAGALLEGLLKLPEQEQLGWLTLRVAEKTDVRSEVRRAREWCDEREGTVLEVRRAEFRETEDDFDDEQGEDDVRML